jgi:hypothetical protein
MRGTQSLSIAPVFATRASGVPTLSVDDEVFWGSDAIDFAATYLKDPGILDSSMRAADALPIGAARKLSP